MTITKKLSKKVLVKSIAAASLSLAAAGATTAFAQDSAEVQELRNRLEALERRLGDAVGTAPELEHENPYLLRDGSGMKIGGTTLTFGGLIKADVIVGSNGDGTKSGYSVGLARNFAGAAASGESDWKTGFSARESRFSFGTKTEDVAGHTLTTYLEIDFNDDQYALGNETVSNGYSPRVRQAYGSWNNWDFGQTYTTFTDLAALPEILNQGKMAAFIYATQPMIRYNMAAPGGKVMVSLENPEDGYRGADPRGSQDNSYGDQSYPDLAVRYQIRGNYGFYSIAGVLRNFEDDKADETKTSGAVSLSARIPTIGRNDLRLQYSYGALGRYMGLYTYPDVDPTSST